MHQKYLILHHFMKLFGNKISNYSNEFDNYSAFNSFRQFTVFFIREWLHAGLLNNMQLVRPNDMGLCTQIIVTSSVTETHIFRTVERMSDRYF